MDNEVDSSSVKSGNSFGVENPVIKKASKKSSSSSSFSELVGLQLNCKSKKVNMNFKKRSTPEANTSRNSCLSNSEKQRKLFLMLDSKISE